MLDFKSMTSKDTQDMFEQIRLIEDINHLRPDPDWTVDIKVGFFEAKYRTLNILLQGLEDMTNSGEVHNGV